MRDEYVVHVLSIFITSTMIKKTIKNRYNIFGFYIALLPNLLSCSVLIAYYISFDITNIIKESVILPRNDINILISIAAILFILFTIIANVRIIRIANLLKRFKQNVVTDVELNILKRYILNNTTYLLIIVTIAWFTAAVVLTIYSIYLGSSVKKIIYRFFITFIIGGTISSIFTYYLCDSFFRRIIPKFFPDGDFSQVKGIRIIPIHIKMTFAFFMSGLFPLIIYYFFSDSYIQVIKSGTDNPDILFKYNMLLIVVFMLSFSITMLSSLYYSRYIARPLIILENVMKDIEKGKLDISLPVQQKDEIGNVSLGFNKMVSGLKHAIKDHEGLIILEQELNIAQEVQKDVLTPKEYYQSINSFEIDIMYFPYNQKVGGDYYHIEKIDEDIISFMIADATGHGIQAALTTMQIDIMNKQSLNLIEPDKRLYYINNFYITNITAKSLFTAFMLNIDKNKIFYSSAGHPAQILIKYKTNEVIKLKSKGKLIGFVNDQIFELKENNFEYGDVILLFTDGIFEEFNKERVEFGEEQLHSIIHKLINENIHKKSMKELNQFMINEINNFVGDNLYNDDITFISIKKL